VLRSHSDGNRHCVRKMWIEREKKAHPANLKTGKQWYNVRGYVPRIEECPGIQETVLTPVLDRFVDGLASRCPRKESKSKRVNHPTVVTPCKIRAQKKKIQSRVRSVIGQDRAADGEHRRGLLHGGPLLLFVLRRLFVRRGRIGVMPLKRRHLGVCG
jgi:hypothetical protein